jgi:hypothetical protein
MERDLLKRTVAFWVGEEARLVAEIRRIHRFRLHSTRGYLPPIEWEQQHTISPLPSTTAA